MLKISKNRIAVFFAILFMVIVSAPTILVSIDDSVDISCFYGIGEEEEESKNLKLLFDNNFEQIEELLAVKSNALVIGYTFKTYLKPQLNLIVPPPEFIL
jgi:hypothetical protein